MRHFPSSVIVFCLVAVCCSGADLNLLIAEIQKQHTLDGGIYASAVQTVSTNGFENKATAALGLANVAEAEPMRTDSPMRLGHVGELLLAVVTQHLITLNFLPQADSSIPPRLLPAGQSFTHPNFLGQPLTLRQLMTHTSGLQDTSRFNQAPFQQTAGTGNTIQDLRTATEAYFLTTTSTGRQVATDVWAVSRQPGLNSSFFYAKSNVALLAYIVQSIIAERPGLVRGPQTVGGLIQEFVLGPLGMINTYFILPDGSLPAVQTGLAQLSGKKVQERASGGGVATNLPVHAMYVADHMLVTSASDLVKLLNALFVDQTSTFLSIGSSLKANMIFITDPNRPHVLKQGFGIVQFDAAGLCTAWQTASGSIQCPVSTARDVWGFTAGSSFASITGMCTTSPTIVDVATTTSCSAAAQAYNTQPAKSPLNTYNIVSGSFDQLYVDRSLTEGFVITPETQSRSALFGFLVFVGITAVIFSVMLLAYFVEYIVQPAPVAGIVTADAYRKPPTRDY